MGSQQILRIGMLFSMLAGCGHGSGPLGGPVQDSSSNSPGTIAPPLISPTVPRSQEKGRLSTFPLFQEVAEEAGIAFAYLNGAAGQVLMVEATGGGAGWLDFDADGLLDLYVCQGGNPATMNRSAEPSDQFFRQIELGRFVNVTASAGVMEQYYSQGVAVGDFDDDGFDDVYITNVGPDTLLWNQGDGTYRDISLTAGVSNLLWSASAAWSDLDGDGDLDLYVCNYVDYDPYHPIPCGSNGRPGTCHPKDMTAVPDECYINQGDGTFTPEAHDRGLFGPENKALGVVIADLNNDGRPDVYVANDTTPNFLFINQGGGRFVESASFLGCAVSREGLAQASMGVGFGDFDQNGWFDLYCTHFTKESNTLYKNLGPTGFQDVTGVVGLHAPTVKYLGFGTIMADFNQDGHQDIFVANGHIDDWRSKGDLYEMEPQLFSYEGPRFVECSAMAGEYFKRKLIGRGVARGDFDNDGDWDLVVVHQNSPTAILRNDSSRGNWLKLRLIASTNRHGWGTRVVLVQGAATLTQELAGGTSYCSSHDAKMIFGLGDNSTSVTLNIRWPNGSAQTLADVPINCELTIRQSSEAGQHHSPEILYRRGSLESSER